MCTLQRIIRQICFDDVIVLGFLSAMFLWTYVGVPLFYLWDDRADAGASMQSANWLGLMVIFLGCGIASFGVKVFIDWWNRPMSVSLVHGLRGSLRQRVRSEIKAHLRENHAIRRARYSFFQRAVRALIAGRSLQTFLLAYLLLDLVLVGAEAVFNFHFPEALPGWTTSEFKGLLKDVASYLIAAQVGILGIVSVAIGIVTLITQRDDRSSTNTDVRLYYVESLAYEVVLSGAALLIILCVQLLWPAQFIAHLAHLGGRDLVFKVVLTALHLVWLLLNLAVFAQFLLTTLHFVEPSARERLRERYTANVIVPSDLWQRLLRLFYATAPKELVPVADGESENPR